MPIVNDFITRPREYVLLNSTDGPVSFRVSGKLYTVPASNKVQLPDAPHVPISAKDEIGDYIPGTLVIKDRYDMDAEGFTSGTPSFSAGEAVRRVLGIDPRTGATSGGYSDMGLSLLPQGFTRADAEAQREDGYGRWAEYRLTQARDIVAAHDAKNETRRKLGMPEIGGGGEYLRSLTLMQTAAERERARALEVLDGPKASRKAEPEVVETEEGPEVEALSSEDLVAKLLADPEAMKALRAKYKVRKIRGA